MLARDRAEACLLAGRLARDRAPTGPAKRISHSDASTDPLDPWASHHYGRRPRLEFVVGGRCDAVVVELSAADFERIPHENLRVPRDAFVAVWTEAEDMTHGDWYAVGVAETCRWIACASVRSVIPAHHGRLEPARAPLTSTQRRAHPELIEREAAHAERWTADHPHGFDGRPGWLEGIAATLDWVWRGPGRPPLDVRQAHAGRSARAPGGITAARF